MPRVMRGRAAQKRDALHVVRGVQRKALMHERFRQLARRSSEIVGSAEMFLAACVAVISWAVLGPPLRLFRYVAAGHQQGNDETFLVVFIIQNAQNRGARAIQLKLDELIRAVKGARTGMVRLEEMTDRELCASRAISRSSALDSPRPTRSRAVSSMTKRPAANVMPGGLREQESKE